MLQRRPSAKSRRRGCDWISCSCLLFFLAVPRLLPCQQTRTKKRPQPCLSHLLCSCQDPQAPKSTNQVVRVAALAAPIWISSALRAAVRGCLSFLRLRFGFPGSMALGRCLWSSKTSSSSSSSSSSRKRPTNQPTKQPTNALQTRDPQP